MSDLPSQYTKDIQTFRLILNLPDPRDSMPRSCTIVWAPDDVAGQQELRPKGPSLMPPLSPQPKYVFDKFDYDFQAANLRG